MLNNTASKHVSKALLEEWMLGLNEQEMNSLEAEFNEWCGPRFTQAECDTYFTTFMEEVYMHTYCDVCAISYHNDDPCIFH